MWLSDKWRDYELIDCGIVTPQFGEIAVIVKDD